MYVGVGARVFVHSCVEKCVRTSRSQLNERSQLLCRRVFTRCHPPALPRQRSRALIWRKMTLDTLVRARAQPPARCTLVPVTLVLSSRTSCRAHTSIVTDPPHGPTCSSQAWWFRAHLTSRSATAAVQKQWDRFDLREHTWHEDRSLITCQESNQSTTWRNV